METICIFVWITLCVASRWIEDESKRGLVEIVLCAIGVCWLIVRSGVFSLI
jgi:hypothetical protein